MSLPWYPPELPPPLQDGYQHVRGDGRVKVRQDAGPPNVRQRYSAVADVVNVITLLDRAQKARFDRFFLEEIAKGSKPFLMPDPISDGWPLLTEDGNPVLTEDGLPLVLAETWVCLMDQRMPAMAVNDLTFRVTFDLAVMP